MVSSTFMRHHLAGDLAEACEAVGDGDEAVVVDAVLSPVTYHPSRIILACARPSPM